MKAKSPMRFTCLQRLKHKAYSSGKILLHKLRNVFVFHVSLLNLTNLDLTLHWFTQIYKLVQSYVEDELLQKKIRFLMSLEHRSIENPDFDV